MLRAAVFPLRVVRRVLRERYIARPHVRAHIASLFKEPALMSVKEFEGVYRVDPRSDIFSRLVLDGCYEPVLAEICTLLIDPNKDVIDVGANVGFFSVLAARYTTKKVCAVEPMGNSLALLRENLKINTVADRVVIFEGAVSDVTGQAPIEFIAGKEEYASLVGIVHPSTRGGSTAEQSVPCISLDELVADKSLNPGFIKVDVEGAEQRVFSGAQRTIVQSRPIFLSEFSPYLLRRSGADANQLLGSLRDNGYRLLDPLMPEVPLGRREFGDLLAVPEERASKKELLDLLTAARRSAQLKRKQQNT